jgi:integrase/recombinase XerD
MPRYDLCSSYMDDTLSLDDLLEMWRLERPINDDTRTYDNYEASFLPFAAHLGRTIETPRVADLSVANLNDFLRNGSSRVSEYSARSKATHGSNVRSLVASCRKLRLVPGNTLQGFELPSVPEFDPRWFSDPEVAVVFDRLERDRTTIGLRLRAAANITLDNGARPEEIVGIRLRDVLSGSGEVRLMGKRNRERFVPLGQSSLSFIADYMRVRPAPLSDLESLFLDARDPAKGVASTTLSTDFAALLRTTSIPVGRGPDGEPGCTYYSLRRTFARRAAENGMDVTELASIMGHSANSIAMLSKHYYTPTRLQKLRAHQSARPADSLHAWRQAVRPDDREIGGTLFDSRPPAPRARIVEGNRRLSVPPSAKRWSGEYRAVSAISSASETGA